ncbi:MAG: GNAT family N-acetyltransferase [Hyphomonadaceae bacterium]|nr:GNAT family N-acetyltransferase [Hyphomonadaceae bacterium]
MLRSIEPGAPDFEAFVAALQAAKLPVEDLLFEPFRYFCMDEIAWGGFSVERDGLMRSVVVKREARGRGFGARMIGALLERARQQGVERLWLLTTDAAPFFERLGWTLAERSSAPAAIAASRQFSGLCPASAMLMVRAL